MVKDAAGGLRRHRPGGQDLARTGCPRCRRRQRERFSRRAAQSPDSRRAACARPSAANASLTSSVSPSQQPAGDQGLRKRGRGRGRQPLDPGQQQRPQQVRRDRAPRRHGINTQVVPAHLDRHAVHARVVDRRLDARRVVVERHHRSPPEPRRRDREHPRPAAEVQEAPTPRDQAPASVPGTAAWSRARRSRTPARGRSQLDSRAAGGSHGGRTVRRPSSTSGLWNSRHRSAQSSAISSVRTSTSASPAAARQVWAARAARRVRRRPRTRPRRRRSRPPRPRWARARAAPRARSRPARAATRTASRSTRLSGAAEGAPELAEHAFVGAQVVLGHRVRRAAGAARAARA